MPFFFLLFAALAGVTSSLQSGSNNSLQKALDRPWWSIVIVSTLTLAASVVGALVSRERLPATGLVSDVPWFGWIGGLFGLVFVLATVYASPKLGAGLFVALIVTASTCTSLILDHFGLMGFEVHPAGWGRIAGGLLMVAGVALIAKF